MSIDYGTKFIGIAISDYAETLALPVRVIPAAKSHQANAQAILKLAKDYEPEAYVVGLALNMDGSRGPQAAFTLRFADVLQNLTPCPVETWDERLSTFAAEQLLVGGPDATRPTDRRSDAIAAQLILQAFLAARRKSDPPSAST
ncbi:MAG: Holliday junction resolvase RuvX [Phycisphaerales bacterium]|nr:Holliday junction resolvase RuvX [Phycisphaerales bacterium]